MQSIEIAGRIGEDGKLSLYHTNDLRAWALKHPGKQVSVKFKLTSKNRSTKMNAYYWGVVVSKVQAAFKNLGHDLTAEQTHSFLKQEFNYREIDLQSGYSLKMPETTTELTNEEFIEYLERIKQFASMVLGIYIPDPNEQTTFSF